MSDIDRMELKGSEDKVIMRKIIEELKKHAEIAQEGHFRSLLISDMISPKQIVHTDTTQQQIHKLDDRQTFSEARIDKLEFQVNVMPFREKLKRISEFIIRTYSDLEGIKTVAFLPTTKGIRLITIHEIDNRIDALNQLQKRFFEVERAFSGIYFEQVVLHVSQVDPLILKNVEVILQN